MHPPFDHVRFITELGYTLIVVFLCFLIYFKTREMFELTKHKGIQYFRNTFLFFGLAYIFRFIFDLIRIIGPWLDVYLPRDLMGPVFMLFTAYLSTMALLCLIYSTIWKHFSSREFFVASNILALIIAVAAAYSPPIFMITQVLLLIVAIVLSCILRKHFSRIFLLYFLLFAFWIISLVLVIPGRALGFELRLALEVISIGLFAILYYKVAKWIK
ncbi:Uncharacterised protein [uncultured archaeon]|nr:Uncharacterised protein [uncultured archaeon]